jgi:dolichol-phosphate mannosyltransferase
MAGGEKHPAGRTEIELSVVVPVHDEAPNLRSLIEEIEAALTPLAEFEILYVDDASTDGTKELLDQLAAEFPRLRVLRHKLRSGQSAAIVSGVSAARAPLIATLDGDGQNDPKDIPGLLEIYHHQEGGGAVMIAGHRVGRRDPWTRRMASGIANRVRGGLLGDGTPDTGCGLKLFARDSFLALPQFDHMHRFLPALIQARGGRVMSVPVAHRRRAGGRSKYGVFDRLWVGITDLFGVMWLRRRRLRPEIETDETDGGAA